MWICCLANRLLPNKEKREAQLNILGSLMIYRLSNLLPSDEDTLLLSLKERIRVLDALIFLVSSMQHAIENYLTENYSFFDAQVSENLCQIRAHQLSQITNNKKQAKALLTIQHDIKQIQSKSQSIRNDYVALSKKRPRPCLGSIDQAIPQKMFLQKNQLNLPFSEIAYILTQLYILSRYKLVGSYGISPGIDYRKLCLELNISSKTYAKKLIHRLQRNVSENSCQYILGLLRNMEAGYEHISLLERLYLKDEVGRHVIACYEVTKIIIQDAIQKKKPIKIIAVRVFEGIEDSITFILKPSRAYSYYIDASQHLNESGLITFVGIVDCKQSALMTKEKYITQFLSIGFENIILANMAQHPQYSGLLLRDKKYNPYSSINPAEVGSGIADYIRKSEEQFLKHKFLSSRIGCAPADSSLFLLSHVRYDNVIQEVMEDLVSASIAIA